MERTDEHERTQDALAEIGRPIVVATHRRSGTHLAIDLLRRHFPACRARKRPGEGSDTLYLNLDRLRDHRRPLDEARALELLRRARRPICKTHELPAWVAGERAAGPFVRRLLEGADVYCVVRDGRDVLRSFHAYTRGHDARTPASLSAFLRQPVSGPGGDVSRVRHWANEVRACLALPGVRRLLFEEIVDDPARAIARLASELALEAKPVEPLLPRPVRSRWGSRWRRLFSRTPEATTIPAGRARGAGRHPGRALDWREAFTPEDRLFFHAEAGDLLIELGYERSDAWVKGRAA